MLALLFSGFSLPAKCIKAVHGKLSCYSLFYNNINIFFSIHFRRSCLENRVRETDQEKKIAPSVLVEKTDDVSRCHHRFSHEMTPDREMSAKIPYWWRVTFKIITVVLLIGWKFPSTNQKHYPDLGSDASTVWNFCACFSDTKNFSRGCGGVVASHNIGCFLRLHHSVYTP